MNKTHRFKVIILCILWVFSALFTGCERQAYACEIVEVTEISSNALPELLTRDVNIGGKSYKCTYVESEVSVLKGEKIFTYRISDASNKRGESNSNTSSISFDENGKLVSFINFRPFDPIANFSQLSEQELEQEVIKRMEEFADFSKYTEFSLVRKEGLYYGLKWQVKRKALCNISISVNIDSDGEIDSVRIIDACADDLYEPFISEEERDSYIWEALNKQKSSFVPHRFEIESETLTTYEGKDAILYTVKVIDKEGFCYVEIVTIYKK